MSIKKILLLACMALAAFAFAAPGAAMAEEEFEEDSWMLAEGEAEAPAFEFGLTGKTKSSTGGEKPSGLECEVHATVTGNTSGPSSTGTVHYQVTTATCVGFGTFKECKVEKMEGTTAGKYSWTYHLRKTKPSGKREIVVTNANQAYALKKEKACDEEKIPNNFVEVKFPAMVWTPDNAAAISSVTITGTGSLYVGGTEQGASVSGELKVNEPDIKKYGIK